MKLFASIGVALVAVGLARSEPVKLLYVGPPATEGSAGKGVELGLAEANQQGRFLGLSYELERADVSDAGKHTNIAAAFVAGSPEDAADLARALDKTPVFNVTSRDDAFRTHCRPNLFHTPPSDKMLAEAVAQWKTQSAVKEVVAQAWHEDFVKFAARDLNNRYRDKWNQPMDDEAWAGWAAVRIAADSIANNPEAAGPELIEYLRDEMEFDGQKGEYMTFRETGQLRQPLLLLEDGELAGEAPVRGVAASDELDSLGMQTCAQ